MYGSEMPLPGHAIHTARRAHQRQQGNHPKIQVLVHNFSRFTWSTFKVSRVRKTEMMIASPTAASAAATTITKNTKTWPLKGTTSAPLGSFIGFACQYLAKATKLRLTAFNINSIDIKMVMMLRLSRKPKTPRENRIALRIRYQERGTIRPPSFPAPRRP